MHVCPAKQGHCHSHTTPSGREKSCNSLPVFLHRKIKDQWAAVQLKGKNQTRQETAGDGLFAIQAVKGRGKEEQQENVILAIIKIAVQRSKSQKCQDRYLLKNKAGEPGEQQYRRAETSQIEDQPNPLGGLRRKRGERHEGQHGQRSLRRIGSKLSFEPGEIHLPLK